MKTEPTEKELQTVFHGCFDGLRGLEISMTLDDALSASHAGHCDNDVGALVQLPSITAQLDAIGAEAIRDSLRESGAYSDEDLLDDEQNRHRAVWFAACDIRENWNQSEE